MVQQAPTKLVLSSKQELSPQSCQWYLIVMRLVVVTDGSYLVEVTLKGLTIH